MALIVDTAGQPTQVHIIRSLAEGKANKLQDAALSLDQKALEAVRQYRFEPATLNGRPIPVALNVEVNFRVF